MKWFFLSLLILFIIGTIRNAYKELKKSETKYKYLTQKKEQYKIINNEPETQRTNKNNKNKS